jgi:hypothetical protein
MWPGIVTTLFYNKTNQMHQFHKFILAWKSTCFGQFVCTSPEVHSLYTQQWYMSYRHCTHSLRAGPGWNCQDGTAVPSWSCSKAVYKPVWHILLLSVQCVNSWWWTEALSETCRVSCQNKIKLAKLVHLVDLIIKGTLLTFSCVSLLCTCSVMQIG